MGEGSSIYLLWLPGSIHHVQPMLSVETQQWLSLQHYWKRKKTLSLSVLASKSGTAPSRLPSEPGTKETFKWATSESCTKNRSRTESLLSRGAGAGGD